MIGDLYTLPRHPGWLFRVVDDGLSYAIQKKRLDPSRPTDGWIDALPFRSFSIEVLKREGRLV